MTFSEVREYQYGDDVRSIDWNVTARFNSPFVKIFEEERELTVMLLVDVSASKDFGTSKQLKKNLITELSAVLSFSAIQNNDKIGVILFSDKIEMFIPPKKGRKHILRIIRELIDFTPESKQTNIAEGLRYFTSIIKKRSIAFLISDFIDDNFEDALKITNKKHDLIALRIVDKREMSIPNVGFVRLKDAETGEYKWVNTYSKTVRNNYAQHWRDNDKRLIETFAKSGVDSARLFSDEDYIRPLINLLKRR
jgi:uncharacterized protein (DUF58 family)